MTLSDQQLRQELMNHGETVPPITQRNREQLRARLEVLRSQTRTRSSAASSPSRAQAGTSPSRTRSTASPSRIRASADSPSNKRTAASPSGRRATASPSRTLATSSPSRTRASATTTTTTTTTSATKTRSKQTPNLIELSDSDNDTSPKRLMGRSGQTAANVQTRSIPVRQSPKSASPTHGLPSTVNMTNDVEQSIARHRREIKQLLDSARDRNPTGSTPTSSLRSGQQRDSSGSRRSPSPTSKSRTRRQSSKSDHDTDGDDDHTKKSSKSDHEDRKKSSSPKRSGKSKSSGWKKYFGLLKNLVKFLLISSILAGGITLLYSKRNEFFPHHEIITCTVKNATECEDMKPVIQAVRKQLQVRTGEVDCGFRSKPDVRVTRQEIENYLDEKGLKFQSGNDVRWLSILKYIKEKPIHDIVLWDRNDNRVNETHLVQKMSTKDAIRSLTCRARQDVNKTLRNLALLILGSTGLLTLAWFLQKQAKSFEKNEATFKNYLKKATNLLQEQYEKHVHDPNTQPWLAINHIRDRLFPEGEHERLTHIWERIKNEITKQDSRIRAELQEIDGKAHDVWRWIKSAASTPKKTKSSSKDSPDESDAHSTSNVGLTECLKLRNCFHSDNVADDEEIDHVVDSIQHRCANVKRIEHIGIHSVFVYLKFSSKEAAAKGYHLLNNWHFQNRTINVKYVRLNRYYEHFPEAHDTNSDK